MKTVYLDNAATTPIDPLVRKAMEPFVEKEYGNPSSIYSLGRDAKAAVENARSIMAKFLGAESSEIYFTSGGTESNNWALKGVAYANKEKGGHIITTAVEHSSVLQSARFLEEQGFKVTYIMPDKYGIISPESVKKAITKNTFLISVMHANNEIGTIEPIREIGEIAQDHEILFHTDAVQTVGHMQVDVNKLKVDLLSLSSHKFYGPKGAGVLYIRKGTKISPILHGGGQEKRMRSGTENTACIVGMGEAAVIAGNVMDYENKRLTEMRDKFVEVFFNRIPHAVLNGHETKRLSNNINIMIPEIEGEAIVLRLDRLGIFASTGSACSALELGPSHVLQAVGRTKQEAHSSLRFTLGRYTEEKDLEYVLSTVIKIVDAFIKDDRCI